MTETANRAYPLVDPAQPQTAGVARINDAFGAIDTDVSEIVASLGLKMEAADIAAAIDTLKGNVPEAYDTLVEIAEKLGDNDDAVAAIFASLATKANAANVYSRAYLDAALADKAPIADPTFSGVVTLPNGKEIDADSPAVDPMIVSDIDASLTVNNARVGQFISLSGAVTVSFATAASLGEGWWCYLRNVGDDDIDLLAADGEQVDERPSYTIYPREMRLFVCDGEAVRSVVIVPFKKQFISSGTFIKPPGYAAFDYDAVGGGGGGGVGNTGWNGGGAGSGGGGAAPDFGRLAAELVDDEEVVAIGTAGIGSSTGETLPSAGGNTTLGELVIARGGRGGQNGGTTSVQKPGGDGGSFLPFGHPDITTSGTHYDTAFVGGRNYGSADSPNSIFGGGKGGWVRMESSSFYHQNFAGGSSIFGAAGGGAGGLVSELGGPKSEHPATNGGTSRRWGDGGRGGDRNAPGEDGKGPGAGGGGGGQGVGSPVTKGGNGYRGELILTGVI